MLYWQKSVELILAKPEHHTRMCFLPKLLHYSFPSICKSYLNCSSKIKGRAAVHTVALLKGDLASRAALKSVGGFFFKEKDKQ